MKNLQTSYFFQKFLAAFDTSAIFWLKKLMQNNWKRALLVKSLRYFARQDRHFLTPVFSQIFLKNDGYSRLHSQETEKLCLCLLFPSLSCIFWRTVVSLGDQIKRNWPREQIDIPLRSPKKTRKKRVEEPRKNYKNVLQKWNIHMMHMITQLWIHFTLHFMNNFIEYRTD